MPQVLTATQRDQAVYALKDVKGILEYNRKPEYRDLDDIQVILAGFGLQIAPIPKAAPLVLTPAPAPASAAPTTPSKLSANDTYWVEGMIHKYQDAKRDNINGYNFKNEMAGKLLGLLCKLAGIPFKL